MDKKTSVTDGNAAKKTGANILHNSNAVIESILREATFNSRSRVYIDHGCRRIKITPTDNVDSHCLILQLDENLVATILSHSLPDIERLFKSFGTIESFSTTFFNLLDQMEDFYGQINTIDELCYVVDPVEITTKCNYRTIKLESRVYLKITIDPLTPSSITAEFYGPTKAVERYRNMYHDGINDWNVNDDIYRNFLRIFDIMAFPQKDSFQSIDNIKHCSICYVYRLSDQIPIISCDNEKCNLVYHTMCLREWFTTVRDSKTFLNVISGRCPFCKEKLSTAFTELLDE